MFRLDASMRRAEELAAERPDRFEVGKTGWVTVRFSDDEPLQKSIWQKWVEESYGLASGMRKATRGK